MSGEGLARASASCDGRCDPPGLADEVERLKARIAALEADSHPPIEIMPLVIDAITKTMAAAAPAILAQLRECESSRRRRAL
jgi:hypothetical protein